MTPILLPVLLFALLLGGAVGGALMHARAAGRLARLEAERQRAFDEAARLGERARALEVALEHTRAELAGALAARAAAEAEAREHQARSRDLALRLDAQQAETVRLAARESELAARLAAEQATLADKLGLLDTARQQLSEQFRLLAGDVLDERRAAFDTDSRAALDALLAPLGEKLGVFDRTLREQAEKEGRERMALGLEIRRLAELSTRLNDDALALTRALTGSQNKTQGDWGEMILESVLQHSGLERGREYEVQVSDSRDEGDKRFRPDVVIRLPEGRSLVIDSKVSLNAWVRHTAAGDDASRETELASHVAALRAHVKTLAEKRYHDLDKLDTLDFVFMFVPVEPAWLAALQRDPALVQEAFERRVVIVGPSTLLASLRTVASVWRVERQNRNAQEIARQAGLLYDRFVAFVAELDDVGRKLDAARGGLDTARRKLVEGRGNLASSAERIRKLGARTSKRLALPVDEADFDGVEPENVE